VRLVALSATALHAHGREKHSPDSRFQDVWGVNVYGGSATKVPEKMAELGWTRPFCVSEYGPTNWWQAKKTEWGARLEPPCQAKAETYAASYAAQRRDKHCIGGYCFKWGWKTQVTPTWICLLNGYAHSGLPGGEESAAVAELARCWSGGAAPRAAAPAPRIRSLHIAGCEGGRMRAGWSGHARCDASPPAGTRAPLTYGWAVLAEDARRIEGVAGRAVGEGQLAQSAAASEVPLPLPGAEKPTGVETFWPETPAAASGRTDDIQQSASLESSNSHQPKSK